MAKPVLTVFGEGGETLLEHPLQDGLINDAVIRQCQGRYIARTPCRYAQVAEGFRVHALYLASDLVPDQAVRVGGLRRSRGRWLTGGATVGKWAGGKAYVGPELFVRQVDVAGAEVWLTPLLVRLRGQVDVDELRFGDGLLYRWESGGGQFFFQEDRGSWALWGAGNTPTAKIAWAIEQHQEADDANPEAFLWDVGAVRLNQRLAR